MFRQSGPIYALALVCIASAGCGKSEQKVASAQRADATSGEFTRSDRMKLTIENVDTQNGIVLVREAEGERFAMQVADRDTLARLKPQDEIDVRYQETIEFSLAEDKAALHEQPVVESTARALPQGVQFGRRVEAAVQVVSVEPNGASATIRVPAGEMRTVHIANAKNREKVAQLRPGDVVDVSYTEKLAVELEEKQL